MIHRPAPLGGLRRVRKVSARPLTFVCVVSLAFVGLTPVSLLVRADGPDQLGIGFDQDPLTAFVPLVSSLHLTGVRLDWTRVSTYRLHDEACRGLTSEDDRVDNGMRSGGGLAGGSGEAVARKVRRSHRIQVMRAAAIKKLICACENNPPTPPSITSPVTTPTPMGLQLRGSCGETPRHDTQQWKYHYRATT